MRKLRDRDLQRMQWDLEAFLNQTSISASLPPQWIRRMITAQRSLKEAGIICKIPSTGRTRSPQLLETMGWPGDQSQASVDFQAQRRWQQALDTAGSLGFDGRRIDWQDFLSRP